MTPTSTTQPTADTRFQLITQKSGVSLALMLVIIGGIVANVSMMYELQKDLALVTRDVSGVAEDTKEIRVRLQDFTDETHAELRSLRSDITDLRLQMAEMKK